MATLTWSKFNSWVAKVNSGAVDVTTDTFKIALSNTLPVATNAVIGDITQIAASNGYTTGGNALTITTASQTGGTFTLAANQRTFTASGGSMPTWRYLIVYDSTTGDLVMWADRGSATTLTIGQVYTLKFNNANPGTIYTMAQT